MFCTTFYSYKGGVGRTLALANVACALALADKRVLVVDFDLEAPGIVTLPGFKKAAGQPGILDLINAAVSGQPPASLDAYVHRCELSQDIEDPDGEESSRLINIDVMPAGGDADGGYSDRLSSIDWARLYNEGNGFLLMEEIRNHWAEMGYDYVLIDSRTGLTDVGGVCTRQLPDAVVAVFFPNEQNLIGMRQVVKNIRTSQARPHPVELLFAPSRVPRLDDEHGLLRRWLGRFSEELEYNPDQATPIEHYDSLMLLDQTLFVLDRPNSGLARQYQALASSIRRKNDADAEGAADYLGRLPRLARSKQSRVEDGEDQRLARISTAHPNDTVIQFMLARMYYSKRDMLHALEACNNAIEANGRTQTNSKGLTMAAVRNLRLRTQSELGMRREALIDAKAILQERDLRDAVLIDAVMACVTNDKDFLAEPFELPAIHSASANQLIRLGSRLSLERDQKSVAAIIVQEGLDRSDELSQSEAVDAQLVLMADHRFDKAIEAARKCDDRRSINVAFNAAMAEWGLSGTPDPDTWQNLTKLFDQPNRPPTGEGNWMQCRALTYAVLGDLQSMEDSAISAERIVEGETPQEFSCWTYAFVPSQEFISHLSAIRAYGMGQGPAPAVLGFSS